MVESDRKVSNAVAKFCCCFIRGKFTSFKVKV